MTEPTADTQIPQPPADQPPAPTPATDQPPPAEPPADQTPTPTPPPAEPPADQTPATPPPDPLAEALRTAADALRQLALATEKDIVPELVEGNTPDEVRASIERSRAAYRAALAHIARSLPTPPTPSATTTDTSDPLKLIARGLSRDKE